ncbi:MAG: diguanylate cyclase [Piscinibacter sp.]|nr:diguanylate cyclase [Piscinibacter sp.]
MSTSTEAEVLLVDDDPGTIQLLARILGGQARLRFATCGEDALALARSAPPDLILLDAEMPGMDGFEVCRSLKADPALQHVAVVFVTARSGVEFEVTGFDLGASDFIAKPISEPLVMARVKTQLRVKQLTDELRRLSSLDALTEVMNRRGFDEALEREWARARRNGAPVSLLMIDVDHFKRFNDRHGHPAGDAALRGVAQALRSASLRPADVVARFGGEEFVMLLPETPRAGAHRVAQRVHRAVRALGLPHGDSPTATEVTVSIGVSSWDAESAGWIDTGPESRFQDDMARGMRPAILVQAADQALYAAKRAGRNRAWQLDPADVDVPALARAVLAAAAP